MSVTARRVPVSAETDMKQKGELRMFEKFKEKCRSFAHNRAAVVTLVILLLALTVVLSVSIATNRAKKNNAEESTTESSASLEQTENNDPAGTEEDLGNGTVEAPTHNNTETQPVSGEIEEFELSLPTQGVIAKGHDATIQVWSETMGDYRVHLGIDIATEENAAVFAPAAGKIEKIWDDALMGRCVAISHGDDIYTFYKNLGSTLEDGIEEGASVIAGQKIGEVGNTALSELADEPHLHMEMTVGGLAVDPRDYFNKEAKDSLTSNNTDGK